MQTPILPQNGPILSHKTPKHDNTEQTNKQNYAFFFKHSQYLFYFVLFILCLFILTLFNLFGIPYVYYSSYSIGTTQAHPTDLISFRAFKQVHETPQCSSTSDQCCIYLGPIIGLTTSHESKFLVQLTHNHSLEIILTPISLLLDTTNELTSPPPSTSLGPYFTPSSTQYLPIAPPITRQVEIIAHTPTLIEFDHLLENTTYVISFDTSTCMYPLSPQPEGGYGIIKTLPQTFTHPLALQKNITETETISFLPFQHHPHIGVVSCDNIDILARDQIRQNTSLYNLHEKYPDLLTNNELQHLKELYNNTISITNLKKILQNSYITQYIAQSNDVWSRLLLSTHKLDYLFHLGDQIYQDSTAMGPKYNQYYQSQLIIMTYLDKLLTYKQWLEQSLYEYKNQQKTQELPIGMSFLQQRAILRNDLPHDTPSDEDILSSPIKKLSIKEAFSKEMLRPHQRIGYLIPPSIRRQIFSLYAERYIKTWSIVSTRHVMSRVSNLFLWDDHDVFDDFGDCAADFDALSLRSVIIDIGLRAYKIYQHSMNLPNHHSDDILSFQPLSPVYIHHHNNSNISNHHNITNYYNIDSEHIDTYYKHLEVLSTTLNNDNDSNNTISHTVNINNRSHNRNRNRNRKLHNNSYDNDNDSLGNNNNPNNNNTLNKDTTSDDHQHIAISSFPLYYPSLEELQPPQRTEKLRSISVGFHHFHILPNGNCFIFLDTRAARHPASFDTNAYIEYIANDINIEYPMMLLGQQQWSDLEHFLYGPALTQCHALIVANSMPYVFMESSPNYLVAVFHDDMFGHWSSLAFEKEQTRLLELFTNWRHYQQDLIQQRQQQQQQQSQSQLQQKHQQEQEQSNQQPQQQPQQIFQNNNDNKPNNTTAITTSLDFVTNSPSQFLFLGGDVHSSGYTDIYPWFYQHHSLFDAYIINRPAPGKAGLLTPSSSSTLPNTSQNASQVSTQSTIISPHTKYNDTIHTLTVSPIQNDGLMALWIYTLVGFQHTYPIINDNIHMSSYLNNGAMHTIMNTIYRSCIFTHHIFTTMISPMVPQPLIWIIRPIISLYMIIFTILQYIVYYLCSVIVFIGYTICNLTIFTSWHYALQPANFTPLYQYNHNLTISTTSPAISSSLSSPQLTQTLHDEILHREHSLGIYKHDIPHYVSQLPITVNSSVTMPEIITTPSAAAAAAATTTSTTNTNSSLITPKTEFPIQEHFFFGYNHYNWINTNAFATISMFVPQPDEYIKNDENLNKQSVCIESQILSQVNLLPRDEFAILYKQMAKNAQIHLPQNASDEDKQSLMLLPTLWAQYAKRNTTGNGC